MANHPNRSKYVHYIYSQKFGLIACHSGKRPLETWREGSTVNNVSAPLATHSSNSADILLKIHDRDDLDALRAAIAELRPGQYLDVHSFTVRELADNSLIRSWLAARYE